MFDVKMAIDAVSNNIPVLLSSLKNYYSSISILRGFGYIRLAG